jgi:hypothetical protein
VFYTGSCGGYARLLRVLTLVLLMAALPAAAQSPTPSPSPVPSPPPSIAAAVDPAVQKFLEEHQDPCALANAKGVPCFPVSAEVRGKRYSVADDLARFGKDQHDTRSGSPVATSPYGTPVAGVSFDPVCTTKYVLRALKGRNNTYWIYRIFDSRGEQIVMRDREIDPNQPPGGGGYELVEKVSGECGALAAFRKADREALARNHPSPTLP